MWIWGWPVAAVNRFRMQKLSAFMSCQVLLCCQSTFSCLWACIYCQFSKVISSGSGVSIITKAKQILQVITLINKITRSLRHLNPFLCLLLPVCLTVFLVNLYLRKMSPMYLRKARFLREFIKTTQQVWTHRKTIDIKMFCSCIICTQVYKCYCFGYWNLISSDNVH